MISQPTPSDFNEILQVWEASVRNSHHFLTEENIQYYKSLIQKQYLPTIELFIIRNENDKIVAFIGLSEELIEMLFVHPAEQGKGHGKQLVEYAEKEKHITKVDVNEQNEKAFYFYSKRGFDVTRRDAIDSSGKPFPILHMAKIPNLADLFRTRIHKKDIDAVHNIIKYNTQRREELFELTLSKDIKISYQALWASTHLPLCAKRWLQTKQEELINEAITCSHPGKRRILLQLLEKQSFSKDFRVDLLDFCLERMVSQKEAAGVKSLCIKLAYKLCQSAPELMQELQMVLDIVKENQSSPAIISSIRNVTKKRNR